MRLTQFIRDRTDVELERLTREEAWWSRMMPYRTVGVTYQQEEGCLLCNTFDLRSKYEYGHAQDVFYDVERAYMRLATRNGDAETGLMIARLARRELDRRAMAAIGTLEVQTEEVRREAIAQALDAVFLRNDGTADIAPVSYAAADRVLALLSEGEPSAEPSAWEVTSHWRDGKTTKNVYQSAEEVRIQMESAELNGFRTVSVVPLYVGPYRALNPTENA